MSVLQEMQILMNASSMLTTKGFAVKVSWMRILVHVNLQEDTSLIHQELGNG
jgi:hypothetical protein